MIHLIRHLDDLTDNLRWREALTAGCRALAKVLGQVLALDAAIGPYKPVCS